MATTRPPGPSTSTSSSSSSTSSPQSSTFDETSSLLGANSSKCYASTHSYDDSNEGYDDNDNGNGNGNNNGGEIIGHNHLEQQAVFSSKSSPPSSPPYQGIRWSYNAVLLMGIFLVNADSSVLLAMFRQVASDFDRLSSASWIITSYVVGMIVAQPLYGKLSDIYGRKPLLVIAYSFYVVGGLLSGTSVTFSSVLLGRTMAGIGNAGITALVSTLIVDMVPLRSVAVWRSYVYAVNQVGRAFGPTAGGLITDKADWRWALLFQVPFNLIGLLVIWFKMPIPKTADQEDHEFDRPSFSKTFQRFDFTGAITLGVSNIALLIFFDQTDEILALKENLVALVPLGIWAIFLALFIGAEGFWAREPLLPLRLMARRNVLSSYLIQFFQTAAQMGLYTSIPLYFRTAEGDSNTTSSLRLLFITLGTVLGGLVSGFAIKKTGLYRLVTLLSLSLSNASFLAIFLRWRGMTGWAETAYGFPVGVGFGVSLSAAFIGLTAGMEHANVAIATSGFYLSLNLGSLFGVSLVSLLIQGYVRTALEGRLEGFEDAARIIRDALANLDNIERFGSEVMGIVKGAYVEALVWVWLFSLACGCLAFASTWIMKEGEMGRFEKGKAVDRSSQGKHEREERRRGSGR